MNKKQNKIEENLHLLCMVWAQEVIVVQENNEYRIALKKVDSKVFYKAARPKRVEGFIEENDFIKIWIENKTDFENEPPEVAIVYSKMKAGIDGIAHAIPITLLNPKRDNQNNWKFTLIPTSKLTVGQYLDAALFIDWLPTPYSPKPIRALFPNLFD